MDLTFVNGTDEQQALWRQGVQHFINLPFAELLLNVELTFVDPSTLSKQTTLAETNWTYGSNSATTEVRNDFPGFGGTLEGLKAEAASMGLVWSGTRFAIETAAHETGHAAYAALSQESRVAIAQMFGATSDDLDELAPEGSRWQDRIIEGIAETFKEAFLPAAFRVFPNRTTRTIPYHEYSKFRQFFRTQIEPGGEEEVGEGGSGYYRTPRVDAYHYGPGIGGMELPQEAPGEGELNSGLYWYKEFISEPDFPPDSNYQARSGVRWKAVLDDPVEVRDPIVVPERGGPLFSIPGEEGLPYMGNLFEGIINPKEPFPPWLGGGDGGFYAVNVEIEVNDDLGNTYAIHWLMSLSYGSWTNTETSEHITGYGSEGIKHFKKNGSIISTSNFAVTFGTTLTEHGMSGLDILKAHEGIGQSPVYDVKKVPYDMRLRENSVRYLFSRATVAEDKTYVWGRMQSLWICPLTSVPPETGPGQELQIPVPSSEATPGSHTTGRKLGQPNEGRTVAVS